MIEWIWSPEVLFTRCNGLASIGLNLGYPTTYTPDATKVGLRASFKDRDIEAVADAVGCSRDTSQSGADDSNLGPPQLHTWPWRVGGDQLANYPLDDAVDESKRVKKEILHDC
jgi:hypothetical protein